MRIGMGRYSFPMTIKMDRDIEYELYKNRAKNRQKNLPVFAFASYNLNSCPRFTDGVADEPLYE